MTTIDVNGTVVNYRLDGAADALVAAGEHDVVTTPDDAAWLAQHIPNATMVTLPAAHLSNVEASAEFNAAAQAFFSTTEV